MSTGTDTDWQEWGKRDPYFGVIPREQYRRERLTAAARDELFASGKRDLDVIRADCIRFLGGVSTRRTLELGCGVGRMLVPLSEISEECVGVDISAAMREEAARNCARLGRSNVRLVRTLDELSEERGTFTFIHSFIVLQHIDAERGLGIIAELLDCLDPSGCAALHVTYAKTKYRYNLGAQPLTHQMVTHIRYPVSRFFRRLRHRDPQMQMNLYDLNRLFFLAQERGCQSGGFRMVDHTGNLGVILYLQRQ